MPSILHDRRRQGIPLVWLFALMTLLSAAAQAARSMPVDLDRTPGSLALLHGEFSYLKDESGKLTRQDVTTRLAQFQPLHGNLGAGYTDAVYWLKLELTRQQASPDWWLEVRPPYLDDLQLYQLNPDGQVVFKHTGDRLPLSSRDASYGGFLFHLTLPEGHTTLLLRVQTTSSMVVIANLNAADTFPAKATLHYLLAGTYLSVVTTMLILSAAFVLIRPQRLYKLYVGYLFFQLLVALSASGIASEYLLPQSPLVMDRIVGFSLSMTIVFGMLFFAQLLRLSEDMRWQFRLFQIASAGAAVSGAAALLNLYPYLAPVMLSVVLVTLAISTIAILQRLHHGSNQDRFFAVTFCTYMIFVTASALPLLGLVEPTEKGLAVAQLGDIVHLLMLQITIMLHIREAETKALMARQASAEKHQMIIEQDQYLALITQEIRAPLSMIGAAADSLQIIDEDSDKPERARRYSRIQQAVTRIESLISLTTQQDSISESSEPPSQPVDLVALTREVLSQIPAPLQERVQLSITTESAHVTAQAGLLQFALFNLIDNAYKYAPPGTPVLIDIEKADNGPGLRWTIRDHGPGIPLAERERVFEKHYRSAERTGVPGLGLGLYIAERLVRRHGGSLVYREMAGAGACFQIWLPLAPEI